MNATTTVTTMHPFERAGLGVAPFRSLGLREITFQAHPGAPVRAGGTCDYCSQGIRYAVRVKSADGKEFVIGMDCAMKLYRDDNAKTDALLVEIHDERRRIQREQRHAREQRQLAEAKKFYADHRDELGRHPHPYHKQEWAKELTFMDYVDWMQKQAGTSGNLQAYRLAKKILNGNGVANTDQ